MEKTQSAKIPKRFRWQVFLSRSALFFPRSEVIDAVVRYAKKKNIPLATGILSGYIDELNRHPELCIPSDEKEIFGRPLKRGEIPTARQLAEELLVCTKPGPFKGFHYPNCIIGRGFPSPRYYSISDLKGYSRDLTYEDPSLLEFSWEAAVDSSIARDAVCKQTFLDYGVGYEYEIWRLKHWWSRGGRKDAPFSMNRFACRIYKYEYEPGGEFSPVDGAWDGEWQESFFAYTRWGKLKVSRHLPRRKDSPVGCTFLYN